MTTSFSIIIPCHNYAHLLGECLESVRGQTFPGWEAIIVDDASTDDPASVVSRVNDSRIRLLRNPTNRGLGASLNLGFAESSAPWVVILSADDLFAPGFLERVNREITEHPAVDVVFPDMQLFGNKSERWVYTVKDAAAMAEAQWLPGAGAVMRRDVWTRAGGNYEGPELVIGNIDWDFWLAAMKFPLSIRHIPDPPYLYRIHGPSTTSRRAYSCHITHNCMYERHGDFLEKHGRGRRFLADGYLCSAQTSLQLGEKLRGALMAAHAWRILGEIPDSPSLPTTGIAPGELPAVRQQLRQALAATPDFGTAHTESNIGSHFTMGIVALEMGNTEEAVEHFVICAGILVGLAPGSHELVQVISLLGEACRRQGKQDLAADAWLLALTLDASDTATALHMAGLLAEQGLTRSAVQVALQAIESQQDKGEGVAAMPIVMLLGRLVCDSLDGIGDVGFGTLQGLLAAEDTKGSPRGRSTEDLEKILYGSEIGRKIWWNYRARDLYDSYGNQNGGYNTLEPTIRMIAPQRLLEIGCGNGRNLPLYIETGIPEIVGQDINEAALQLARQRGYGIKLHHQPVQELDYPESYFDLVVSNRVLQHIPLGELEVVVAAACRIGRFVYINEMTPEEMSLKKLAGTSFDLFVHDYDTLFRKYGYTLMQKLSADSQIRQVFQKK